MNLVKFRSLACLRICFWLTTTVDAPKVEYEPKVEQVFLCFSQQKRFMFNFGRIHGMVCLFSVCIRMKK